MPGAAGRL
ncbi:hypothetical protein EYF80_066946 [Liparis tanakae]|uniref:Uncharacterized protein n=1 Tax=Liparis tanakae TaxID=230148 RepID=A0A4Z2E2H8_9TELE|nr:hypothetical protein EYF80_066946 [Liparis tanakae]